MRHRRILTRGGFCLVCLLAACVIASRAPHSAVRAQSTNEYQEKAVFLYNIAKFVNRPSGGSTDPQSPIAICIVGADPFGSVLDNTLKGKTINGQDVVVKRFRRGQDARVCNIAFIGSSQKDHLQSILESLKGTSVLTVGDAEGFAELGGVINFTMVEDHIHFEVNVDAAARAHLKISSKLLSLAKIVRD